MRGWQAGLVGVVLMTAAGAVPVAPPAYSAGVPAVPGTRAMWLWDDRPAAEVVTWASVHGVRDIFVHVMPAVLTDGSLPRLREMRQRADAAGIRLTALGGDGAWATEHDAALAWLRAVVATGLFGGVHVDVEPYLLPAWSNNLDATVKAYLGLLEKLRTGSPLPVDADVPFWYGQYTVDGKNLATEVLRRVDAVTVMSYRDTGTGPNSMVEISQDWLVRGAANNRRVRLGAETTPLAECPHCTFAEEGATALGNELAKVDAATRTTSAYAGIAVHRYDSWRELPA
jgi:hypothetical protein